MVFLFFERIIEENKNNPMTTAIRNKDVQESNEGVASIFIWLENYNKATKRSSEL